MIQNRNIKLVLWISLFGFVIADHAQAGTLKPVRSPLSFDLTTRKKTKIEVNDHFSFSGSVSASYLSERNLKLDDQKRDYSNQYKAILEVVGRARVSESITAFAHLEFSFKGKDTHIKTYDMTSDVRIKEAFFAYRFINGTTVSLGRLRLSDKNKWIADKAVDGAHFSRRNQDSGFEIAIVKDDDRNDSTYALAHYTRFQKKHTIGVYAIAERSKSASLGHLVGYINNQKNDRFTYTANVSGILGNAIVGEENGVGFDFRATQKITQHAFNPQITFGLAFGSKGFRQTGLQSNKTKDGGQTLCNRYGFVYQPDLTNLAVASVGLALRPNRKFSVDLNTYLYVQVSKQATTPSARLSGSTTGNSSYLGAEVSLIGAWRPTKKMKVEFGAGVFQAGSAYQNKNSTKRFYIRATRYF
jgi:hypothetical protein